MKFSERIGITPVETALQIQGMNDALAQFIVECLGYGHLE